MFLAKTLLAAAVLGVAALGSPAEAAPPPTFDPPKQIYLALGDSVAYGYQQATFDAGLPPSAYDTGYVDDLAARLRQLRPGLAVVNRTTYRTSSTHATRISGASRTALRPRSRRSRGTCTGSSRDCVRSRPTPRSSSPACGTATPTHSRSPTRCSHS
jgi:hypothetical protein